MTKLRITFLFIFFLSLSSVLFGQAVGDYRSNKNNFNWNDDSGWQRWNGTAWVTPTTAQGYPGKNAAGIAGTVTIQAGHTVSGNVDVTTNDLGRLIVAGTLNTTNNWDMDVTGNVEVTGTINLNGDNSTLDIGGGLVVSGNGVFNAGKKNIYVTVGNDYTMSNSATMNLSNDEIYFTISGRLNMNDGTSINMSGNSADQKITVNGDLIMAGTSQITGNNSRFIIDVKGNFEVPAGSTNARLGGVKFDVAGTTDISGTFTITSNTGDKRFNGATKISGSWTSTAVTSSDRVLFRSEVVTSGTFKPGCH
jgi:hypothetical protein